VRALVGAHALVEPSILVGANAWVEMRAELAALWNWSLCALRSLRSLLGRYRARPTRV